MKQHPLPPKKIEKPEEPADPTHPPSICPVCQEVLPFIEYGCKPGKDGRIAKWPIYAKCSKKNHPKKTPKQDDFAFHSVVSEPIRILEGRSGPKGLLIQLDKMTCACLYAAYKHVIDVCTPSAIRLRSEDIALLMADGSSELPLPLVPDNRFTPGYRYVQFELPKAE